MFDDESVNYPGLRRLLLLPCRAEKEESGKVVMAPRPLPSI